MQAQSNHPYPAVQDLYQATEHNLPWEQFKYQVPANYHHNNPNQPPYRSPSCPKLNYLDYLIKDKKNIPAPNAYQNTIPNRPLSGKMDKKPRKTLTDQTISKCKQEQLPGPGAYLRPKTADAKINRNMPEHRQHYLNEVQYLASQNPGVGEYNLDQKVNIQAHKFNKPLLKQSKRVQTQKSKKEKFKSTLIVGTFDWLAAQNKPSHKNFFGRSNRFNGPSKYDKKPGPTSYKLNSKWSDPNNILHTTASFSNLKSVYYN